MDNLRITSPQNPRIKAAARLRDHRHRQQQQRIIIDGWREILAAQQAGVTLLEIYFDPTRVAQNLPVLEQLAASGSTLIEVTTAVLEKLAFGQRNEGLVAVAAAPRRSLPDLRKVGAPLVLILEDLEKPGNIGAIFRTASAAGVDGIVSIGRSSDLDNPNTIRASLGTIFSVPCCSAGLEEVQRWLAQHGLQVCAARVDAEQTLYDYDFTPGTAIVFGSEAHGLSAHWTGQSVTGLRIPMQGAADSLNVSVSAAVVAYEAYRQRLATSRRGLPPLREPSHGQ